MKNEIFNTAFEKFNIMYGDLTPFKLQNKGKLICTYRYGKLFIKMFNEYECHDIRTVKVRLKLLETHLTNIDVKGTL